jgi:hypothetical protein
MSYTEDTLVQQTTADYLEKRLGWQSVYAYSNEDFGPASLLSRGTAGRDMNEIIIVEADNQQVEVRLHGETLWVADPDGRAV